jgi:gamma-glutamyltranspeptidase/glutathione hydrolase
MKPILLGLSLLSLAFGSTPAPASGGAVASADLHATRAGLEILESGGSAADAAVACALVLAVTHPQAGNLAGGGFAIVLSGSEAHALDFRETAPAAAHRTLYLDGEGNPVPGASTLGPLSTGVPGTPDGLFELHRRFGRLPWRRVVRPAVTLAERGFAVRPRLEEALAKRAGDLARFPEAAETWLPDGAAPAAGTRIRLPELARSLRSYARRGPSGVTEGRVAEVLVEASARHGGILTLEDLAGYEAVWREPVFLELESGWQLASMPLPSSGGLILAESLALFTAFDAFGEPGDPVARTHQLAEAWRRAYADRFAMGDPDSGLAVEPAALLSRDWLRSRAAGFDPVGATPSESIHPWPGEAVQESAETTHLSVVDADGNAVSLTTTLNATFGSKLWVPEVGFLNNEMDDFTTAPGRPNLYGLIQGPANEVVAGRRMLSSMSPTIAWRRDERIALGSPGGSRIPTAVFQVLLGVLGDGRELRDAVAAPRVHHQWMPDRIDHEPGALDEATRAALEAMGHDLNERSGHGEVHAVRRRASGRFEAVADERGPGAAAAAQPCPLAASSPRQ